MDIDENEPGESIYTENQLTSHQTDEGEDYERNSRAVSIPIERFINTQSQKRKRDEARAAEERASKLLKAMLGLVIHDDADFIHDILFEPSSLIKDSIVQEEIIMALYTALHGNDQKYLESSFLIKEINGIRIPRTYKKVINDKNYSVKWSKAIQLKIESLVGNGTWEEIDLPRGAYLVSTKWVFIIKTNPDGSTERFKARLVARGFSQEHGIDYTETFAPTVQMDTLRLFLAMVAKENFECFHFDIKNAFTEATLKEEIFLSSPEGVSVKKGKVLRALRSLYGLKQAGRNWSLLLKRFLLNNGFNQGSTNPCLFVHNEKKIWLLVYVDDIASAAKERKDIDWFNSILSVRYNAKSLGEISKILGVRITRDREKRTNFLDQEQYLNTTLDMLGFPKGKHQAKKIPAADYENFRPTSDIDERINASEYQHVIGKLMYAMILTRPDIAFVLGRLAQHMSNLAVHHGHAIKSLMWYLRSTINQRLRYGPGGSHEHEFGIYTDADWASDKYDRKSILGGVRMFYGWQYSWASKKQSSVSTSSTESEYISQSMYAKQGLWTAQVFRDLGLAQLICKNKRTVQMYGDNQGALALVKNPHLHARSRHIDVSYHFIRDLAEKRMLQNTYIPTVEMIADGLKNPLARVAFERFKRLLGLVEKEE